MPTMNTSYMHQPAEQLLDDLTSIVAVLLTRAQLNTMLADARSGKLTMPSTEDDIREAATPYATEAAESVARLLEDLAASTRRAGQAKAGKGTH